MRTSISSRMILSAVALSSLSYAQTLNFPSCVSQCIDQSTDNSCSLSDVKCICRESNGNFLPDMIACVYGACDNSLDTTAILGPLQTVCSLLGTPLSNTAVQNAENLGSSLSLQATTTVTVPANSGSALPSQTTVTVTSTVSGTTVTVVYPASIAGNTIYLVGSPSPLTQAPSSTSTPQPSASTTQSSGGVVQSITNVIPVVIVGIDSAGSSFTSTTTEQGPVSTFTTTVVDSAGSTKTVVSTSTQSASPSLRTITTTNSKGSTTTYTTTQPASTITISQSSSGSSDSVSSTTTETTSVAAIATTIPSTTDSSTSSKTQAARPSENTNGSPFDFQNAASSPVQSNSWLGLSILIVMLTVYF